MNILDFDKWSDVIKEGINTNITSDDENNEHNKSKDENEITIDDTTYIIKKNKVSTNDVEISNDKLKTDIKNANRAIGDLKETEERFEELRLTGGEHNDIADKVIDITCNDAYNDKNNELNSLFKTITDIKSDFFTSSGKITCIKISDLLNDIFKNNEKIIDDIKNIFNSYETGIGKGEYFLPLVFKDVYKKRPFGIDPYTKKRVKGDNYILNGEDSNNKIYDLELKAPNASLNFNTYGEKYIKTEIEKLKNENLKNENLKNEKKSHIYKNAITSRFLNYAKSQAKSFGGNLYMCIFDENNPPENILFINLSKVNDNDIKPDNNTNLFKKIYDCIDIINIKTYTENKKGEITKNDIAYSFSFTYDGNTENPKLKCKLKSKKIQETLILSRDNFINEYYTNKKEVN